MIEYCAFIFALQLNLEEYAAAFQKAETYIHASNYGLEHEESCLMQILDDFLSAQNEGKSLDRITGPNIRRYCDAIIKAELSRFTNQVLVYIEMITLIPVGYMIFVLVTALLYHKNHSILEGMKDLRLDSGLMMFAALIAASYLSKRLTSKIFFNYARISKIISIILYVVFLLITSYFSENLNFPELIRLPFPAFVIISLISLLILIICIVIEKKTKVRRIVSPEITEDEESLVPEQVICPSCGKTHDYDYPRCPYCKYKADYDTMSDEDKSKIWQ